MTDEDRAAKLEQMIDANLKRAFDDVLKEDVPDRFTNLLAELRAAEPNDNGDDAEEKARKVGGARNGG